MAVKVIADVSSLAVGFGVIVDNVLPPIFLVVSIIWLGLRMWESKTVQGWRKKSRCDEMTQAYKVDGPAGKAHVENKEDN